MPAMQPFFLEGSKGRLFAIYTPPMPEREHRADVLYVHPFAEEMNRSRRMADALARRLSNVGCGMLSVDPFGTGDSAGEFVEARLETWRDDLQCALSWLTARRAPALAIVGLRLGALLGLEAALAKPPRLARVVLWQPVLSGEVMLTQLLRAAAVGRGSGTATTTALRARLTAGEPLEVAGYEFAPEMAAALDVLRLEPLAARCPVPVNWFEVVRQGQSLPPAAARLAEAWCAEGVTLDIRPVPGDPYWSLPEPRLVMALINATVALFEHIKPLGSDVSRLTHVEDEFTVSDVYAPPQPQPPSCVGSLARLKESTKSSASGEAMGEVAEDECPIVFRCGPDRLLGILHLPVAALDTGVLFVVGGPQYRVGSHRQYLTTARDLAQAGIPVFRFDGRGMGDSDGPTRSFDEIFDLDDDIQAAIDAFAAHSPGLRKVVLWGLCGSCCANLFYAYRDHRVGGMVLVNPWVRSDSSLARARLWHYYPRRVLDPSFWRAVARGDLQIAGSLASFMGVAWASLVAPPEHEVAHVVPFTKRMLDGLQRFSGPVLFILSGDDLTAREFADLAAQSPAWRRTMASPRIQCQTLPGADHTFSSRPSRTAATERVLKWIHALIVRSSNTVAN